MIIWKNTCGESWQRTIENGWEVSGKPGAFLFFIPKGALTHHLLKQAVVALPLVGHVRSPRGIASPAGAAGRCHSPLGSAVIVHADGPVMRWQNATSHSYRLPAQTCHRQICRRKGRNKSFHPCLVGCRDSRRPFRKRGEQFQHPFRKDKVIYGDLSFGG